MEIVKVDDVKKLKKFLRFQDKLYEGDENFVPYIKSDIKKTLKKLLFEDKTYTALTAEENGVTVARILYTVDKHKQYHIDNCGIFYIFECVNDQKSADAILSAM